MYECIDINFIRAKNTKPTKIKKHFTIVMCVKECDRKIVRISNVDYHYSSSNHEYRLILNE